MLEPRLESSAAVVGGKIYGFGGFRNNAFAVSRTYDVFNPATSTWTALGTMPANMAETHTGIAHDDRYIYFLGGLAGNYRETPLPNQTASNRVWRYDTTTDTFTQIATMPQVRGGGGAALVDRKLHWFGGFSADNVTNVNDHYIYDLDTGLWSNGPALPDSKDHFATVTVGTKIYILGGEYGHHEGHQQQRRVDVFDTATNAWTRLADMPISKSHNETGTFVSNGRIVMAGGQVDNYVASTAAQAYNIATNSWTTLSPNLPAPRQGAVVQRVGNRVYVQGGAQWTDQPRSETWSGLVP